MSRHISSRRTDVIVIGAGTAGHAAAIRLALAGCSVIQLSRASARAPCGESLSPSAVPILRELGVWPHFVADAHLPCHLNVSFWGGPEPRCRDFMLDPHGAAWHVDRGTLERRLAERAGALGVARHELRRHLAVRRVGPEWRVSSPQDGIELQARWLIDATGRASGLARRAGAHLRREDRQIAVIAAYAGAACEDERNTLIEAVEDGWWYSGPSAGGRLWCAFFTDMDLLERSRLQAGRWAALLARASHVHQRVMSGRYALATSPRIVQAGSARLDRFAGPGWLTAGDAAVSHDPIASHGLTFALASGRDAAQAIAAWFEGDADAPTRYAALLEQAHALYARIRSRVYAVERRWPASRYWERRHHAPTA